MLTPMIGTKDTFGSNSINRGVRSWSRCAARSIKVRLAPSAGGVRRGTLLTLAILAVVLFAGWWVLLRQPPKPMFHHVYGRHEFGIRKEWIPTYSAIDDHGNIAKADEELNLLFVAVDLCRPEVGYTGGMRSSPRQAEFTFSGDDYDVVTIVERQQDRAVFVTRDGVQHIASIDVGEAILVVDSFRLQPGHPNLIVFMAEAEGLSTALREKARSLVTHDVSPAEERSSATTEEPSG
jgi:hypothetical protein